MPFVCSCWSSLACCLEGPVKFDHTMERADRGCFHNNGVRGSLPTYATVYSHRRGKLAYEGELDGLGGALIPPCLGQFIYF